MTDVKEVKIINTIGRRKTSIARVYLQEGSGQITVNKRDFAEYFPTDVLQTIVKQPIVAVDANEKFDIRANVTGGGVAGQAEALRHAIARALTYKGKAKQRDVQEQKRAIATDAEEQPVFTYPDKQNYAHLIDADANREILKKEGLLIRDPRMVERKKYGRRKARRRFQFSKR
ncbi:30S ribosomal protein S9 [uncultured Microscilla sp.]|uniref:30S ribosomal protein S9 n=1 Tax=uncultured Microscilla sp. TaxID=432653 RepID=UPI00262C890B|nr:30S ribosomal protein S9 [uncultured Microscilla sp.]